MSFRYVPWLVFVGSLAVLGGLIALWWNPKDQEVRTDRPVAERAPVVVHVAAAMRPALEKAATDFEAETGLKIELRFGPSETLLTNLRVTGQGDLFLPADDSYVSVARKAGLVEKDYAIASMKAVMVLRADFPRDIKKFTWEFLFQDGFRLVQPNPDITAIGKLTRDGLTPTGAWARIENAMPAMVGSVTEAANAIKLGSGDGAIIWDAVAHNYPTLKLAHLPGLENVAANVAVAVCKNAGAPTEARWFAEYLAGEQGQEHLRTWLQSAARGEEMTAAQANARFYLSLGLLGSVYVVLILAMVLADICYTTPDHWWAALQSREIQYAIKLTLVSCLVTAVLSLWVAVPLGYLLSRTRFWGRPILETILDIPIILPPMVIGLSLLIVFQTRPGKWIEATTANRLGFVVTYIVVPALAALLGWPILRRLPRLSNALPYLPLIALIVALVLRYSGMGAAIEGPVQSRYGTRITFQIPAVILAQFAVSCAFAVRTMRVTFDQISPRTERVALTLGCTRSQAFWLIALPEARRGLVSAGTLAWARALGEFGPILVFAGATRMRTEVLSTTVFLEWSVGRLEAAIAVSLLMVVVAVGVLLLMRAFGLRGGVA